jgi:hypothetical protein
VELTGSADTLKIGKRAESKKNIIATDRQYFCDNLFGD